MPKPTIASLNRKIADLIKQNNSLQEQLAKSSEIINFAETKAEKELRELQKELAEVKRSELAWKKRFSAFQRFAKSMMMTDRELEAVHEHVYMKRTKEWPMKIEVKDKDNG